MFVTLRQALIHRRYKLCERRDRATGEKRERLEAEIIRSNNALEKLIESEGSAETPHFSEDDWLGKPKWS